MVDMERNSDSYIGTFDTRSESDTQELNQIRQWVKAINSWLREEGYDSQYYVKAQGRGPRLGNRKYYSSLPLKFAERVDAYIYKR